MRLSIIILCALATACGRAQPARSLDDYILRWGRPAESLDWQRQRWRWLIAPAIDAQARLIEADAPVLQRLGLLSDAGDSVVIDLDDILSRIAASRDDIRITAFPRARFCEGICGSLGYYSQYSYLGDYGLTADARGPLLDPRFSAIAVGAALDMQFDRDGTGSLLLQMRVQMARLLGARVCVALFPRQHLGEFSYPWEEPELLVGEARARDMRIAPGKAVAVALRYRYERTTPQVRGLVGGPLQETPAHRGPRPRQAVLLLDEVAASPGPVEACILPESMGATLGLDGAVERPSLSAASNPR